jgi:ribonuclease P protein component
VGVTAGKTFGTAVRRNRAKRLLRAAIHPLLGQISPSHDLILIARLPILQARLTEIQAALTTLLQNARLLEKPDET